LVARYHATFSVKTARNERILRLSLSIA
jgi:hypothetical protein